VKALVPIGTATPREWSKDSNQSETKVQGRSKSITCGVDYGKFNLYM